MKIIFLFTITLLLISPQFSWCNNFQKLIKSSVKDFKNKDYENSYEKLLEATDKLAEKFINKLKETPLKIKKIEILKLKDKTDELVPVKTNFNLPDEFYLRFKIDGLNREKLINKYRYYIKQKIKITAPGDYVILEEEPVDLEEKRREIITNMELTNRITIFPDWPEGKYKVEITVEDMLEIDEKLRIDKKIYNFIVKKK